MQCQLTIIVVVCNVLVEAAMLAVPWLHIPGLCRRCISGLLPGPWATAYMCLTDSSLTHFLVYAGAAGCCKGQPQWAECNS